MWKVEKWQRRSVDVEWTFVVYERLVQYICTHAVQLVRDALLNKK